MRSMGISQRNTAYSCGCARSTVQDVERLAIAAGIKWPLPEEMTDEALRKLLYPPKPADQDKYPIDCKKVAEEYSGRHMTLTLCWNEYCDEAIAHGKQPYQYSAFCSQFHSWVKTHCPVMHVEHKCAERIEVDWSGDPAEYFDPDTGESLKAWVFVACLPWSQYIFAKAYKDMSEAFWIGAHIDAFNFFGGTTPLLVPDNCKTGVIKNTVDELIINEQYRRMAEYYGCAVVPARPRRPKDKSSVEASVGLVQRQVLAPLRHQVFLSLEELNKALAAKVDAINARPFQKRVGSRKSEYLGQEKDSLIPLPAQPYRIVITKRATVQFNYHVAFEGNYYSVPFTYLRQEVEIKATKSSVSITLDGTRIATHKRHLGRIGTYITNPDHMPDTHKDFAEWNGERFRKWAQKIGPATYQVIDGLLTSRTIEQQAYRTCRALLDLSRRHSDELLEQACAKALEYSKAPSYKTVKTIIAKLKPQADTDINAHAYLRGSDYYNQDDK